MTYRGVPGMHVHLFQWRELKALITHAGFVIQESIPIGEITASPIVHQWLFPSVRAGGWIVFARKP